MTVGGARHGTDSAGRRGQLSETRADGDAGAVAGAVAAQTTAADRKRRPWWVWVVPFAVLSAVLVARNAFLFSQRLYEDGDMASNSIRIEQARHFTLLIGDYSRLRFSHPGPAYMYVQAWGEELCYDILHVVPTPWNGQVLAVYALNSAFVALAVGVVYGWTRSVRGAAACLAAFAAFAALHPLVLSSDWMSYLYMPTYAVFVIAAGSVAAGRARDAWILALTGWFLIHGHAAFLFFVPVIVVAALAIALWPARGTLRSSARTFFATRRGVWVPVAAISALFLLPIVINLALHWPGDFGKYFSYGSSGQAGGHPLHAVVHYILWFWWPHAGSFAVPVLLYAVAFGVTWWLVRQPVRRFLLALLAINLVSSAAFVFYTFAGVDDLSVKGYYIGYFYWSAPLVTLLVIAVALAETIARYLGSLAAVTVACLVAAAAVGAVAVRPLTRTPTTFTDPAVLSFAPDTEPGLAAAVSTIAARSPGKTLVIKLDHNAWRDMTGFLVQAERTGVRACVDNSWWTFMVTSQFICTPRQVASGARYYFYSPVAPKGTKVLVRLYASEISAGWRK
jgi:hypothetical protein